MAKDYSELSKEELLKLIEKQEKELTAKKYGMVWDAEREPEQVVLDCENNLPVLKRVKGKEIRTNEEEDNILIEGDNYHALTVLNYTHKEKIDVIYIDPPYNTGNNDFVYNDRYVDKEDGFRHSKWLNFMEKRLNLAKELLKETGVIFISIDDNEVAPLRMLCNKIFNEKNYISCLVWEKKKKGSHLDSSIINIKEYVLVYCANSQFFSGLVGETVSTKETYPCINPGNAISIRTIPAGIKSNFREKNYILKKGSVITDGTMKMKLYSNLVIKNGYLAEDLVIEGEWRYGQSMMTEMAKSGELYVTTSLYLRRIVTDPRDKKLKDLLMRVDRDYLLEKKNELLVEYEKDNKDVSKIKELIDEIFTIENIGLDFIDPDNLNLNGWGSNEDGDDEQRDFFGEKVFDYPKPSKLITKLLLSTRIKDAVVLDFMAGTGTTGHAVLRCNKLDSGNRRFIICTNNGDEKISHKIASEICYPRVSKVINGYKNSKGEKVEGLGGNLQYFRTDLIKKAKNKDQVRIDLTQKCTEMLCVKENIFNLSVEEEDYKIFVANKKDRFLCVYYNFLDDSFEKFLKEIKKLSGKKIIYMFSIDGKINSGLFAGVDDFTIEEIPQKIVDIYKRLVKMNIPIKSDHIFSDFIKAKEYVFAKQEKDEGARILRIVIEKVIQKIAQNNGVNILKDNTKEEKLTILNDKLKSENIFSKVDWEENKTYIAIGNHAAHGEYSEYDLKNVANFYQHIQKIIERHNLQ